MANTITDACTNCAACQGECPNDAISEGSERHQIDPSKCDECAGRGEQACRAVCSSDAIGKA